MENNLARLREVVAGLDDAARLYEAFWESAADILCIVDRVNWVRVNPAFLEALGWQKKEIEGKPWRDLIHPEDAIEVDGAAEHLKTIQLNGFISRLRTKDGRYAAIEWSAPVWDGDGITHSIGRLIEVTDG